MDMEDYRCRIVATKVENPRYKQLITGVMIVQEDSRCKNLCFSLTTEVEDPRCKSTAMETEDPRCKVLNRMW
jgi:predicted phosphoadenosine phosphosulfate sulfurtransferase